jgi:hypothetical protein
MIGGSLRVFPLPPPLKLVDIAEILFKVVLKRQKSNQINLVCS